MKGLLLKDFYQATRYCRSYLLIAVVFLAVSVFNSGNSFFIFYPCLIWGMIPATLLAYDERSHWQELAATLPVSRAQFVSAKYLLSLLGQLAMLVLTGICQILRMKREGGVQPTELFTLLASVFLLAALGSSVSLPFMFKLGVERGRGAYYFMIGVVCAAGVLGAKIFEEQEAVGFSVAAIPLLLLAGCAVTAVSWVLSVKFYQRRELH